MLGGVFAGEHIANGPGRASAVPARLDCMSASSTYFFSLLRYLVLPARPAGLLLILVLAVCFAVCARAGLIGLPGLLLLLSWSFNYGYVLLEQVAHGAREPPVLAIEMLNPATEYRPLLQCVIVGAVYYGLHVLAGRLGTAFAMLLEALALLALPASIAVLAVGEASWHAINPLALWQFAHALGLRYVAIVVVALGYGSLLAWCVDQDMLPNWLLYAAMLFAWLSVFSLIGGGLYEARDALGHEAIYAPERAALRLQQEWDQERRRFIDGVYAQARSGNLTGAWQTIQKELAAHDHSYKTYDWLLEWLGPLDDPRLASRVAQDYIRRALGRDNGRVTELARERLAADPQFRPYSALETLRVAELVRLAGDRANARRLLEDFAQQFPDSPPELQAKALSEAATLARDSL
jgi:hypothetical protein